MKKREMLAHSPQGYIRKPGNALAAAAQVSLFNNPQV
jgi:hypothetical protein